MLKQSRSRLCALSYALLSTLLCANVVNAIVLDDPLQGSTTGTRENGVFVAGGWKVTHKNDTIYWHIPTTSKGAYEYDVKGLNPNECRTGMEDKSDLSHMYDYTYFNSDTQYGDPGYRNNPFKHFVRKTGCLGSYNNTIDSCELLWAVHPNYVEPDTPVLSWNPATTYRIRVEWGTVSGQAVLKWFRDGVQYFQTSVPGTYAPPGHSFRIAASPRRAPDNGAPLDAIFSNVKVYDLNAVIPTAPTITKPTNGQTLNTRVVFVEWTGDSHTLYQMQINTSNQPDTGVMYDSGQVSSDNFFAFTSMLDDNATYYAFVRLGSTLGFGPWSAGRQFIVNTSSVPGGQNIVVLKGNSISDNNGPFNGLGVTYMSALYWAKFDRNLLNSDLAFLASKDFNYIRILSQVNGGCCDYWDNRGIHPINYTSPCNCFMPAWTDYAAQLQYLLDTTYDTHGMRTEITVFGGAGEAFPTNTQRQQHLDRVLNAIAGREHKVIHLEVANEGWQTGFPGAQGVADMRTWCQYLTDRTGILTAISATPEQDNASLTQMYSGSTADVATQHYSRDLGPESGWFPVRDCWETEFAAGVPPASNNEPVGPGSSVSSETDPIKLVMAAAFSWGANLPMYVYHTSAGVRRDVTFQSMAGVGDFIHLDDILPGEIASWVRNDGKEASAAFTTYSNGQANKWWPEVAGATSGVVRNTGKIKGGEFCTFPIGILAGGVELEARRPMSFQVYNPLTGAVVYNLTKNAGERFTLAQGPRAYIIKGIFTDVIGPTTEVSIDLGSPDVQAGMTHPQSPDGETTPFTIGGRTGRKNLNAADDFYFYLGVSDAFAFQGNKPNLYVLVDYYDSGTHSISLQYDATGSPYTVAGDVTLTNTNTWKQAVWHVTDAYFGNRQNAGADLRIACIGPTFYLDEIMVTTVAPGPPVIAEVSPDPKLIYPGEPFTQQLTLTQGSPAPTWSVVQGPAGLLVSGSALVSGWTPSVVDLGDHLVEIQATNSQGLDTESWIVRVLSVYDFDLDGDSDITDFGHMQTCFSGSGIPYASGCEDADSNLDGDVDSADFNSFVPCMTGSNQVPGC